MLISGGPASCCRPRPPRVRPHRPRTPGRRRHYRCPDAGLACRLSLCGTQSGRRTAQTSYTHGRRSPPSANAARRGGGGGGGGGSGQGRDAVRRMASVRGGRCGSSLAAGLLPPRTPPPPQPLQPAARNHGPLPWQPTTSGNAGLGQRRRLSAPADRLLHCLYEPRWRGAAVRFWRICSQPPRPPCRELSTGGLQERGPAAGMGRRLVVRCRRDLSPTKAESGAGEQRADTAGGPAGGPERRPPPIDAFLEHSRVVQCIN